MHEIFIPTVNRSIQPPGGIQVYTFGLDQSGESKGGSAPLVTYASENREVDVMNDAVEALRNLENKHGNARALPVMLTRDDSNASVRGRSVMLGAVVGDVLTRWTRPPKKTASLPRLYITGETRVTAAKEPKPIGESIEALAVSGMVEKLDAILEHLDRNPAAAAYVAIGSTAGGVEVDPATKRGDIEERLTKLRGRKGVRVIEAHTLADILGALNLAIWRDPAAQVLFLGANAAGKTANTRNRALALASVAAISLGVAATQVPGIEPAVAQLHDRLGTVLDHIFGRSRPAPEPAPDLVGLERSCDELAGHPLDPELPPDTPGHGIGLPQLKLDPQRQERALAVCEAVRKLDPSFGRAVVNAARVHLARGDDRLAQALLEQAPAAGKPMARYLVADMERERGAYPAARAAFEEIAARPHPVLPALVTLAAMQACALGGPPDPSRARQLLVQAVEGARTVSQPTFMDFAQRHLRAAENAPDQEPSFCSDYRVASKAP